MAGNNSVSSYHLRNTDSAIELLNAEVNDSFTFYTWLMVIGATLIVSLANVFIFGNEHPGLAIAISLAAGLLFYLSAFWLTPWLIDLSQQLFYQTRWVSLAEFADLSPETAIAIRQLCTNKSLTLPRIGIVEDRHPTAFMYSSTFGGARLIVSRGLFELNNSAKDSTTNVKQLSHSAGYK